MLEDLNFTSEVIDVDEDEMKITITSTRNGSPRSCSGKKSSLAREHVEATAPDRTTF
ncbi:MAG TPA: hypothetical protein PKW98_13110 [Candidatus Wallbacteria bacterium]|nr:hypothetical protein [Candidatus Wallbacteria bacterium]